MQSLITSLRLALITLAVCSVSYTAVILGLAHIVAPQSAEGSLIVKPDGTVLGSRLIAQAFTQPRYFWPRPSAVGHNAAGAGGSNKSPTSPDITARAKQTIASYGASTANLLPADLAAASGSGLDPHITECAALWQAERVAGARLLDRSSVAALVREHAFAPAVGMTEGRIVNVLELNLALDRAY